MAQEAPADNTRLGQQPPAGDKPYIDLVWEGAEATDFEAQCYRCHNGVMRDARRTPYKPDGQHYYFYIQCPKHGVVEAFRRNLISKR